MLEGKSARKNTKPRSETSKAKSGVNKRSSYIVSIILNVVFLFIANNLLNWHFPFLTSEFVVPLRVLNVSLTATITANLVFLFYDPEWFLSVTKTVLNVIGFAVAYVFWVTFPFDFSSLGSERLVVIIVRIALALGIIGSIVGVVVEFTKAVRAIMR